MTSRTTPGLRAPDVPGRPGAGSSKHDRPDRPHLGLALAVIATAQLMVVLDATIVNVALPHIQRALAFSDTGLEWVVNVYALTFGGLLLLGGRAGDLLGRRKVFIAGVIVFTLASLAGGFAATQAWLLAARAVQGAGAAIVAPTALSLVTTTFPDGPPRKHPQPDRRRPQNGLPAAGGQEGARIDHRSRAGGRVLPRLRSLGPGCAARADHHHHRHPGQARGSGGTHPNTGSMTDGMIRLYPQPSSTRWTVR